MAKTLLALPWRVPVIALYPALRRAAAVLCMTEKVAGTRFQREDSRLTDEPHVLI